MKKSSLEVYQETLNKLQTIKKSLSLCQSISDFEKSDEIMEDLRRYDRCSYCRVYRKTLEERSILGVCDGCPLHLKGERIASQKLGYNGCYRIPAYRSMVKSAIWFTKDPCESNLKKVIEGLQESMDSLKLLKLELIFTRS